MIVLKFGGSSVKSANEIKQVMHIIQKKRKELAKPIVAVFSAMGGVTDLLIQMSSMAAQGNEDYLAYFHQFKDRHTEAARQLLGEEIYDDIIQKLDVNHQTLKNLLRGIFLVREVSPRTMDYVLSFGERNSAYIISYAFEQVGQKAQYVDARKVITTNKNFGSADVDADISYQRIQEYFNTEDAEIFCMTGFIAADKGGLTTTLGRGGSDYTAALVAAALETECLEIWTDVDGVLTADPRKVKKAFTVPVLSYAEAMEMSHFGAKVIYPPTIQPALNKSIPIYIKNTFNPNHSGTRIHSDFDAGFKSTIKGISSLSDASMLTLEGGGMMGTPGFSGRLFSALANENINVILITQASSEYSISFAVKKVDALLAKETISKAFNQEMERGWIKPVRIENDLSIVAVIGEKMKSVPGVAGKLFHALGQNGINISAIAQGSSELNISFVIHQEDEIKALNLIHDSFFLSDVKRIHLFSIGVGLIGSTLLEQVKKQNDHLRKHMGLEIVVAGISNSKNMLFDSEGIDLDKWKDDLNNSEVQADVEHFIERMNQLNLPNSIFVDNTASKNVPKYYQQILSESISVVTPNKVATSSSYLQYLNLKKTALEHQVKFLYETNVGAGLPVINTLQGLINSGDRIRKIEAVVSGSLSFIFNHFDGSKRFSELVKEAKTLGYTEPDPREDLSGSDVRRKIIILTREAGIPIEPEDAILHPILNNACNQASSIEAFFDELEKDNDRFEQMVEQAKTKGEVLRFIASTEGGKATIGLQSVDHNSPFFSLEGSDNMIVFTTDRYAHRPLIVRGPGAGAEVTAGGVFADIISIGK